MKRVGIFQVGILLEFPEGDSPRGREFDGWNFSGGSFPGGSFPRTMKYM